MWKAAFTGRSETGSSAGRPSSQKKKSSGSVVSSISRDERRKSGKSSRGSTYDDYDDDRSAYGPAPSSRSGEPRGLTESAVQALSKDDDLDWEDDDKDARSERRSVKSGKSGRSERHRRKSERERSRSRSRSREKGRKEEKEKRKSSRRESEMSSQGKSRSVKDGYGRREGEGERAMPEMGSFEQFPGQYSHGMMGQAGQADHMMSGGISGGAAPLPSAPDQQFGPTREDSYGHAAGYYLDEGQSVLHQPGVRTNSPNMLVNPDHHLHAASLEAQPVEDTGNGAAAEFFSGEIELTEEPQPINKPGKKPTLPSPSSSASKPSKPGRTSSLGTAAAATAALGMTAAAAATHGSSSPSSSKYGKQPRHSASASGVYQQPPSSRPGRHNSEQISPGLVTPQYPPSQQTQGESASYYSAQSQGTPGKQTTNGTYYAAPNASSGRATPTRPGLDGSYYGAPPGRQSEGKTGKYPSQHSNAGMYAAGAAAAGLAGYAAYEATQHSQSHSQSQSQSQYEGTQYTRPLGYAPSAAYTSGSYADMQQQRQYHEHKGPMTKLKDGFLNLLSTDEDVVKMEAYTEAIGVCKHCFDPRTSPWDAPRRHHYHSHGSRRDSFEELRRRRSLDRMRKHGSRENLGGRVDKDSRYYASDSKRKSGSKADLAAAGLAGVGLAAGANALFNSGKDFEDTYSVKSGHRASSAARRRSRSSSREKRRRSSHGVIGRDAKDDYVFVKTKDGRTEKRKIHPSRSSSNEGRSSLMGAAAGVALGAAAVGTASHRRRRSRSSSRGSSPGLAGILGFSDSKSKRGRHSPRGSYHDPRRAGDERPQSPGLLGGFFTSPSPKRRNSKREHRKKKAGFFTFANGSSSSSDDEMAFGDGFSSKANLPLRRKASNQSVKRKGSDQRLAATIAGIGTTAAALAAAQKGHRVTKRTSRPELGAKRRQVAQQDPSDEDWEDELPSDASSGSSLAFGDFDNRLSRRQSKESMTSNGSGAGGLGAWGWRWGGKDKKKRRVPSPPPAYPPRPNVSFNAPAAAAVVGAVAARDAARPSPYDSRTSSTSGVSQPPLQYVDPRPVSESPSVSNRVSMPGSFDVDEDLPIIRPGPAPIQQPRPVAPIQPTFTDRHERNDDMFSNRPKPHRTQSSPVQSSFGMKDAAMIGAAAIGTASIIASQSGRRSREPKDVRFGLTEEQQAKEERERSRQRERAERNERARADRERALKEEAARVTREQDVLRRREEENLRAAEAKVAAEREAEESRREEARLLEMRECERQDAARREEARQADEVRRQDEAKRRREAEIEAESEAKRHELEEDQRQRNIQSERRRSERRDFQSDRKPEPSSSIPWGAVAAGTAAAVTAGAVYADHEREKDRDRDTSRTGRDRSDSNYTAREIKPTPTPAEQLADQDVFDPAFFKRNRRSPNRSPSGDRQIEEIARKAYERIREDERDGEHAGDYDRMIREKEEYYHEPARSQADVFAPRDIVDRTAGYKEGSARGGEDDVEVKIARDADGHVFDAELYGPESFERSRHAPFGVPRLGLIAPTPPPDLTVKREEKKKRERSPLAREEVPGGEVEEVGDEYRGTRSEVGGVRTSEREVEDSSRDTRSEPGGRQRSRSITWGEPQTHVYEVRTPESYRENADGFFDAKDVGIGSATAAAAAVAGGAAVYAASSDKDERRERSGTTREEEDSRGYRKPFYESVSDLGMQIDSPGTEGAPPVQGFVEGEIAETPKETAKSQHVPGGWDDEPAQGEYFDAPRDAQTSVDEGTAWEPPLSKKEKKKREKEAKRKLEGEGDLEEVLATPPVVGAEAEPVVENPTAEEEVPYEMLSKKDKKKRDKVRQQRALEEVSVVPPTTAETEREVDAMLAQETASTPTVEQADEPAWEPPLSKKEQKKREKLKKAADEWQDAPSPAEPERIEDATPTTETGEEEIPYELLSKKDKKKRDKLRRSMSEDVASPPPEPEATRESTPIAVEEEIPYDLLSKKEQKKRDKLRRSMSEDIASPPAEPERIVEPEPEPAWEPPLSKKEQKKREKEAKKSGFADVATAAMTTTGIAAVAGAAASTGEEESESWDTAPSSKKGKKGKKAKAVERDIRDIETAAESMPGGWEMEQTTETPPEVVDPFQFQIKDSPSPPAESGAKEVDPMDEFADVSSKSSKKKGKKAKRDSLRFNEPEVSSPLRSEVPFDDYIGGQQASSGATDGFAAAADETEERLSWSQKYEVDDRPLTESPRRVSPDDSRSVASEPTGAGERRRRSRGDVKASDYGYEEGETDPYDDVRSVAASEPADIYERRKSSKRRSKVADDDDTASLVSSRSRREKDDEGKKEKKGGGFFGLFGKKSTSPPSSSKSDGAALSRTPTRDSKDGYDDDTSERKHRRRKSEYADDRGGDDDARSVTSESRRQRHHHRRRTDEDIDASRSNSESGTRHHHRRRTDSLSGARSSSQDQSFLGMRVEGMPPLPDERSVDGGGMDGRGVGTPGFAAAERDGGEGVFQRPGETVRAGESVGGDGEETGADHGLVVDVVERNEPTPGAVAAQETEVPALEEAVEYLPALPESPPDSPTELRAVQTPHRPMPLQRPTSTTAVPLRFPFGQSPATPGLGRMERAASYAGGNLPSSPSTPHAHHKTRQGRPTSGEIMPLYLVERTRKPMEVEEVELPSLPSSKPSSRASSVGGSDEYESAVEEFGSPQSERVWRGGRGLAIDTESANAGFRFASSADREDYLGSQQTTPRATERVDPFADVGVRQQNEFFNSTSREQEGGVRERPQPQFYTWEDYERDEAWQREQMRQHDHIEEGLPALPPSRRESRVRSRSGSGDLAMGVVAALAGGAAVLGYDALEDRDDGEGEKRELTTETADVAAEEPVQSVLESSVSKKKKKGKKGKKQQDFEAVDEGPAEPAQPAMTVPIDNARTDTEAPVDLGKPIEDSGYHKRTGQAIFTRAGTHALEGPLETEEQLDAGEGSRATVTEQAAELSSPVDAEFFEAEQHVDGGEQLLENATGGVDSEASRDLDEVTAVPVASAAEYTGLSVEPSNRPIESLLEDEPVDKPRVADTSIEATAQDSTSAEGTSSMNDGRSVADSTARTEPHLPHLEEPASLEHAPGLMPAAVEATTSVDTDALTEAEFASSLNRKQSKKARKQAKKGGAKKALDDVLGESPVTEDTATSKDTAAISQTVEAPGTAETALLEPASTESVTAASHPDDRELSSETVLDEPQADEVWEARPTLSRKQSKKQKKRQKQQLDVFGEEPTQKVIEEQTVETRGAAIQDPQTTGDADKALDADDLAANANDGSAVPVTESLPESIPLPDDDDSDLHDLGEEVPEPLAAREPTEDIVTTNAAQAAEPPPSEGHEGSRTDLTEPHVAPETTTDVASAPQEEFVPNTEQDADPVVSDEVRAQDKADDQVADSLAEAARDGRFAEQAEAPESRSLPATEAPLTVDEVSLEPETPAEPVDEFSWSTGSKKKGKKGKKAKKSSGQTLPWDAEPAAAGDEPIADENVTMSDALAAGSQPLTLDPRAGDIVNEDVSRDELLTAIPDEAKVSPEASSEPAPVSEPLVEAQQAVIGSSEDAVVDERLTPAIEDVDNESFWAPISSKKKCKKGKKAPAPPVAEEQAIEPSMTVGESNEASLADAGPSNVDPALDTPRDLSLSDPAGTPAPAAEPEDVWTSSSSKKKKGKKAKKAVAAFDFDEQSIELADDFAQPSATDPQQPETVETADVSRDAKALDAAVASAEPDEPWEAPSTKKKGKKGKKSKSISFADEESGESGVFAEESAAELSVEPQPQPYETAAAIIEGSASEPQDATAAEPEDFRAPATSKKSKKGKKAVKSAAEKFFAAEESALDSPQNELDNQAQGEQAATDDGVTQIPAVVEAEQDDSWTPPAKKKKGKKARKSAFEAIDDAQHSAVEAQGEIAQDASPVDNTLDGELSETAVTSRDIRSGDLEAVVGDTQADDLWQPLHSEKEAIQRRRTAFDDLETAEDVSAKPTEEPQQEPEAKQAFEASRELTNEGPNSSAAGPEADDFWQPMPSKKKKKGKKGKTGDASDDFPHNEPFVAVQQDQILRSVNSTEPVPLQLGDQKITDLDNTPVPGAVRQNDDEQQPGSKAESTSTAPQQTSMDPDFADPSLTVPLPEDDVGLATPVETVEYEAAEPDRSSTLPEQVSSVPTTEQFDQLEPSADATAPLQEEDEVFATPAEAPDPLSIDDEPQFMPLPDTSYAAPTGSAPEVDDEWALPLKKKKGKKGKKASRDASTPVEESSTAVELLDEPSIQEEAVAGRTVPVQDTEPTADLWEPTVSGKSKGKKGKKIELEPGDPVETEGSPAPDSLQDATSVEQDPFSLGDNSFDQAAAATISSEDVGVRPGSLTDDMPQSFGAPVEVTESVRDAPADQTERPSEAEQLIKAKIEESQEALTAQLEGEQGTELERNTSATLKERPLELPDEIIDTERPTPVAEEDMIWAMPSKKKKGKKAKHAALESRVDDMLARGLLGDQSNETEASRTPEIPADLSIAEVQPEEQTGEDFWAAPTKKKKGKKGKMVDEPATAQSLVQERAVDESEEPTEQPSATFVEPASTDGPAENVDEGFWAALSKKKKGKKAKKSGNQIPVSLQEIVPAERQDWPDETPGVASHVDYLPPANEAVASERAGNTVQPAVDMSEQSTSSPHVTPLREDRKARDDHEDIGAANEDVLADGKDLPDTSQSVERDDTITGELYSAVRQEAHSSADARDLPPVSSESADVEATSSTQDQPERATLELDAAPHNEADASDSLERAFHDEPDEDARSGDALWAPANKKKKKGKKGRLLVAEPPDVEDQSVDPAVLAIPDAGAAPVATVIDPADTAEHTLAPDDTTEPTVEDDSFWATPAQGKKAKKGKKTKRATFDFEIPSVDESATAEEAKHAEGGGAAESATGTAEYADESPSTQAPAEPIGPKESQDRSLDTTSRPAVQAAPVEPTPPQETVELNTDEKDRSPARDALGTVEGVTTTPLSFGDADQAAPTETVHSTGQSQVTSETTVEDESFAFSTKRSKKDKRKAKGLRPQAAESGTGNEQDPPPASTPSTDDIALAGGLAAGVLAAGGLIAARSADDGEETKAQDEDEWPTFSTKKSKKDKRKGKKDQSPAAAQEIEAKSIDAPHDRNEVERTVGQSTAAEGDDPTMLDRRKPLHVDGGDAERTPNDNLDVDPAKIVQDTSQPSATASQERTLHEQDTSHSDGQHDIDFAATVAAGLQDSGFNPEMVVNDPVFHRRATPPDTSGEADPEEVFESFSKKKKKKGKKGKQPEAAAGEPFRDLSGAQTPGAATGDFDQILAQSLAGTGVDPSALEQSQGDTDGPVSNDLAGDAAEFSFATTRRKKGKKRAPEVDQDAPWNSESDKAGITDTVTASHQTGPIDPDTDTAVLTTSQSVETTDKQPSELPPAASPTDRPELSRQLTVDTNATETTSALTSTPGTPLLDPAADLVHAGDRDMDVDDMDAAYRAYKRNKRKQKKQKWAAIQAESASETPQAVEADQFVSREAVDAVSGQAESEKIVHNDFVPEDFGTRALSAAQRTHGETDTGEYLHASEISQSPPKAVERESPQFARSTASYRDHGDSQNDGYTTSSGHEAAEMGAVATLAVAAAGARALSSESPRLRGESSHDLPPDERVSPSLSEDGSRKIARSESTILGDKDRPVIRDSGYQEMDSPRLSRESAGNATRALPDIRAMKSKESLHSRRSNEALYISTDTGPDWNLKTAKRRSADSSSREESQTLHARTPSQNAQYTPLEPTSRNRASYLFQSPPANLRSAGLEADSTPTRSRDAAGYFPQSHEDVAISREPLLSNSNRAAFSPPPTIMSPRLPLDSIPEEHLGHKRSVSNVADATGPDHKARRRSETPQSIRAREGVLPSLQTASSSGGRSVSNPGVDDYARSIAARSPSVLSNRSNISANQWKSPDELRSYSRSSNRSNTPSLRRTSLSGDLRAASRRGGSGSTVGARSSPKTIPFEAPPTPPSNDDEVIDAGASRSTSMSGVYQGYGDAQGSQVSPTRPPSMRKRQSMHIMDLESKLEQLAAENEALQTARQSNGTSRGLDDHQSVEETLRSRDLEVQQKDNEISQIRAMLQPMQEEIARLTEMNNGLTEANRNLVDDSNNRYASLQREHADAHEQWQSASRELDGLRSEHGQLTSGLRAAVEAELATALADKNSEIRELREELDVATEKIRALQLQIQSTRGRDFLTVRDEDYFDGACQKLCQHVQQWVLRFSKVSDKHICRLSTDLKDDKIEARLDNAILDGSDVDKLLGDRVRRRDVFMSVVMTMVWEYVFTRYLFGMDREQRQKLKGLEKLLSEVGPPRAVAQWRATTLTLLAKRPVFAAQRDSDEQAVANEIFELLCALLPPPASSREQLVSSLLRVIHIAVDLSIEMRTQRSEYIMLPPLLPEYDTNGDLMHKVHFNASLMNERSGMFGSNEELEQTRAVVKIVLFPLVVKKGDEVGEGEEEIVVCPAQVLVHNDNSRGKKVVRVESGHMTIDDPRRSRQSLMSGVESNAF